LKSALGLCIPDERISTKQRGKRKEKGRARAEKNPSTGKQNTQEMLWALKTDKGGGKGGGGGGGVGKPDGGRKALLNRNP